MEDLLFGRSRTHYCGQETEINSSNPNIRVYLSTTLDSYRFVYYVKGRAVAAYQVMKHLRSVEGIAANVFTQRVHRGKGYARALHTEALKHIKYIRASSNQSEYGKIFATRVIERKQIVFPFVPSLTRKQMLKNILRR